MMKISRRNFASELNAKLRVFCACVILTLALQEQFTLIVYRIHYSPFTDHASLSTRISFIDHSDDQCCLCHPSTRCSSSSRLHHSSWLSCVKIASFSMYARAYKVSRYYPLKDTIFFKRYIDRAGHSTVQRNLILFSVNLHSVEIQLGAAWFIFLSFSNYRFDIKTLGFCILHFELMTRGTGREGEERGGGGRARGRKEENERVSEWASLRLTESMCVCQSTSELLYNYRVSRSQPWRMAFVGLLVSKRARRTER